MPGFLLALVLVAVFGANASTLGDQLADQADQATHGMAPPSNTPTNPGRFVAEYQRTFPALARGRSETQITRIADRICSSLQTGPASTTWADDTYRRATRAIRTRTAHPTHRQVYRVIQVAATTTCPTNAPLAADVRDARRR